MIKNSLRKKRVFYFWGMHDPRQEYIPLKELSVDDRPRERMITQGRNVLSNAEILAILIGSGTHQKSAV
ncbi:MAG: UPF0758 domain-containing protein [Crocinitomicaceae bacterium]